MRIRIGIMLMFGILATASFAAAQRQGGGRAAPDPEGDDDLVVQMMRFDKNKDGELTKAEVTDRRLKRLFDQIDADKNKVVTKEELTAFAAKERANDRGGPPGDRGGPPGDRGGPPGDRGGPPGDRGGPPGDRGGPPGFGPPGGPMGRPPRPGEILPQGLQQRLKLTTDQKSQLAALQKDVDAKLEKILNDDQKQQLKELRERGPRGPGGPGGPDGPPGGRRRPGGGGPPPPPPGEDQ